MLAVCGLGVEAVEVMGSGIEGTLCSWNAMLRISMLVL